MPLFAMRVFTLAWLTVANVHATLQNYTQHNNSYCQDIFCSGTRCKGGIHYGNENATLCRTLCDQSNCTCYDWRDASRPHPSPTQPSCRLSNKTIDVAESEDGYASFTVKSEPSPTPAPVPISNNAWINYGCRGAAAKFKFCNASIDIESRLDALVELLTLEEKASQLQARSCPPIDRLGIPFFCWGQNAINGLASWDAGFPIPVGLAATFNMTAVRRLGQAAATNARIRFNYRKDNFSKGYTCPGSIVMWGPTINIERDPRWGRNFEVPSEDPYLTGAYASAWTKGAQQGEDPQFFKSIVTLKHWAAYSVDRYSGPDYPSKMEHGSDRYTYNALVDSYDFWDTYAPPFEAALDKNGGNARGVMCSYNEVNGIPSCFSPVLRDVLRTTFEFDGYVTSDTDAISSANNHHNYHNYTNDTSFPTSELEAITYGLRDGRCDIESSVGSQNLYATKSADFVKLGLLDESLLDTAIRDTFRVRIQAGLFDSNWENQSYAQLSESDFDSASNDIEESHRDAIVLLQNKENMLPWIMPTNSNENYTVAFIGPFGTSLASYATSILPSHASIMIQPGCEVDSPDKSGFEKALEVSADASHVILCLGSTADQEHEYHDRANTSLPGVQSILAQRILSLYANKTAVVLSNRGAPAIDNIKDSARAILLAWEYHLNGRAGPIPAAIEAIYGLISPSGRLPYTIYPQSYIKEQNFFEMSMTKFPGRSYKYYRGTPLWPFGWGLSFANFSLALVNSNDTDSLPFVVQVHIGNTGKIAGDEVLLIYFVPLWRRPPGDMTPLPQLQLIDFTRVFLDAGDSQVINFTISKEKLRTVSASGNRSFVRGDYRLMITNGATNIQNITLHL